MNTYKLNDSVIARICQILQEGLLLGIDVTDLFRQMELVVATDASGLELSRDYVKSVDEMHKKLLAEAEVLKAHRAQGSPNKIVLS